jgi:hypothetical protein
LLYDQPVEFRRLTHFPQLEKYLKLDQKGSIMAEYIWIDGSNGVRSKTKVSLLLEIRHSTRSATCTGYHRTSSVNLPLSLAASR